MHILLLLAALAAPLPDPDGCDFTLADMASMVGHFGGQIFAVADIPGSGPINQVVLFAMGDGVLSYSGVKDGCVLTAGSVMRFAPIGAPPAAAPPAAPRLGI